MKGGQALFMSLMHNTGLQRPAKKIKGQTRRKNNISYLFGMNVFTRRFQTGGCDGLKFQDLKAEAQT